MALPTAANGLTAGEEAEFDEVVPLGVALVLAAVELRSRHDRPDWRNNAPLASTSNASLGHRLWLIGAPF